MSGLDEIDDFDSIEETGSTNDSLELSSIFNVTIGGFGMNSGLSTYMASVKVNDLEKDISFYEQLTKDKSWPVSQIIQREVDKVRVSNISRDYILGKGRMITYFPPIIIALLPKAEDGKINNKVEFSDTVSEDIRTLIYEKSIYRANDKLKNYFLKCENLTVASDLYLLKVSKAFDLNLLCWDKSKYYAIVIDGQHRLNALLKSKSENPIVGEYKQDVVFLDFNEFIKKDETKTSPVEVVRRIFIDINTNAKKVDIVRQILMDDKDLSSLIVQSLVESVNSDGTSKSKEKYFKSELVDWYGRSLKHQLPHLTGVLSMYQIVNDYLIQNSLNSINDLRSKTKVKKWVKTMNEMFFVDQLTPKNVTKLSKSLNDYLHNDKLSDEIEDELEDEFKESELFTFDYQVLEYAVKRFNNVFAESFVLIFNKFEPYKKVYSILEKNDGFKKGSNLNSALISSSTKLGASSSLRSSIGEIRSDLRTELYENYSLIFTVLFQKVIFYNLIQEITRENSYEFTNEECLVVTNNYIERVNNLIEIIDSKECKLFGPKDGVTIDIEDEDILDLGTIATSFWDGMIYENGNIIYNTQGIRTLSATLILLLDYHDNAKSEDYKPSSVGELPYVRSRIKRIIKKQNNEFSDIEIEEKSQDVINLKDTFLKKYFCL